MRLGCRCKEGESLAQAPRRKTTTALWFVTTRAAFALLLLVLQLENVTSSSSSSNNPQGSASYYSDPSRGNPPPQRGGYDDGEQYAQEQAFGYQNDEAWNHNKNQQQQGPPSYNSQEEVRHRGPPPPPPPPGNVAAAAASTYTPPPIHYQFQSKDSKKPPPLSGADRRGRRQPPDDVDDGIPLTSLADGEERSTMRSASSEGYRGEGGTRDAPAYASARRDVITVYMDRSIVNRWMVRLGSGAVGAAFLTFVGTSLTTKSWWTLYAWMGFWLFLVTSWFRTPYGELCRASGFLLLETMRESRQIRRDYPTRPHLRALLGAGPRRPFPPADNPWNYRPSSPDDPLFSMVYSIAAMTIVGSFCGGNIPMVPSWIGALVGAGFFGLLTTRPNARGDLARATGMRVVATVQTLWDLQKDLNISPKFWKVASLLLDKLLILDRQHRLKDKLVAFLSLIYDQILRVVQQMQGQQQQEQGRPRSSREGGGRRPPPRGRGPPRRGDAWEGRGPPDPPTRRRPPSRDERFFDDNDDYDDDYRRPSPRDQERSFGDFLEEEERREEDHASDAENSGPPPEESKRRRSFLGF